MSIPKDFEKFGKQIWDAAMNAHIKGARQIIVPFKMEDGGISRVTVDAPTYIRIDRHIDEHGNMQSKFISGKKKSDGIIEWDEK